MQLQTKILKSTREVCYPKYLRILEDFCKNIDKIPDLFFREQYSFRRFITIFNKYDKRSNHKMVGVTKQGAVAVGSESDKSYGMRYDFMPFEKFMQQEKRIHYWSMNDFVGDDLSKLLHEIKPREITSISNQEVRREAVKRVGIDKLLSNIDNKILEKNEKGEILFDLFKFNLDSDFGDNTDHLGRFMYVQDGTRKDHFYMLEVPKVWVAERGEPIKHNLDVLNLHIAKAWSFRIHPTKYFPEVET